MGCGSGRAIADIVSGRQPDLNFEFTGETRHALTPPLISIPARG
jgi:D-amino-acid dehydrogenase